MSHLSALTPAELILLVAVILSSLVVISGLLAWAAWQGLRAGWRNLHTPKPATRFVGRAAVPDPLAAYEAELSDVLCLADFFPLASEEI